MSIIVFLVLIFAYLLLCLFVHWLTHRDWGDDWSEELTSEGLPVDGEDTQ